MNSNWEEALLGTVLNDPNAFAACEGLLPSDFTGPNRLAFVEIIALAQRNAVGVRALAERLNENVDFRGYSDIGNPDEYVANLSYYRGGEMDEYVRQVLSSSTKRAVKRNCALIAAEADGNTRTMDELLNYAEEKIMGLRRSRATGPESLQDILATFIPRLQDIRDGIFKPAWTPDCVAVRDILDFAEPSECLCIAARPGTGKSSYLRFEFLMAAVRKSQRVGIINMENDPNDYARGYIALYAGIDGKKIKNAAILNPDELQQVKEAASSLAKLPIFIRTMSSPSAALVRQTIRRMVHENKIQMVGIDYLQLMDNGLTNQVDDISMSSKNMRASSIELGIPHFDVAQLNRAIETRSDGAEPMLSDLRGSGCVAGETLVVMADGTRKRIDSLVGENVPVMALNQETMKLQPALASKVWMTGERQVFKLTTSLGNEIKATTNHKFLTVSGWKRLDEIQRGECIATSEVKWDQVIDIAQDDVVPVYDAEVPVHHNFIAGEIVVHNSIEQDHTAVVFIRSPWTAPTEEDMRAFPENIDPRTNRTLDRPKVIPVHFFVAKNRNGEMGKSDLVKWNKATGAFQTLVRE